VKRKIVGHEAKTNRWGYVFVLPFLLAFIIFNLWPTVNTFVISFTDLRGLRNDYIFSDAVCQDCRGSGRRFQTCPDCEGKGTIATISTFSIDDIDAENDIECSTCEGEKDITFACRACDETGRVTPVIYNYNRLVNDSAFWGALKNTFIIWGMNFVPQLGIALILAIWLSDVRLNLVGRGLFRAIVYMPNLLTMASVALLFRSLFGFGGHATAPANQFLGLLGIRDTIILSTGEEVREAFNFFRSVAFSRGLVSFIQWWMWYGHTLIMMMAGITSIPASLYESATVDGANSRQTAWYITLPLLRPMMLFVLVTSMIGGMQMFDIPFLLTNQYGSPGNSIRTTTVYQFNVAFMGAFDRAYGATISIGIFIVTIILAMIIFFFLQDRSELQKRKRGG
jgi:multiple sugar transport system permease protein